MRITWSEVESRTQGSRPRPRPRTQKKSEAKAKAKDSLPEDRHSRGQGQECSRPRPRTKDTKRKCSPKKKKKKVFTKIFQAISKKKRSSQKFFKRSPRKNVFQKIFQPLHKILTFQKIVLSSSRGQANFRGLEASRPRPRTWPSRPRPRTSKCVLEDVLEAKDVLEDSTSELGKPSQFSIRPLISTIFRDDYPAGSMLLWKLMLDRRWKVLRMHRHFRLLLFSNPTKFPWIITNVGLSNSAILDMKMNEIWNQK